LSAELIQDAIVDLLKNTSAVAAEFGVNISKGMGRNFDFINKSQGIRIYQLSEQFAQDQLPNTTQRAIYPFAIIILFYEPDEATGETRKTQYSKLVRAALEADQEIGGTCYNSVLGDTRFYFHSELEGAYYLSIPLVTSKRETVG